MFVAFIHGPPASGKLTIARRLHAATGLPLFHNHLVVDIALSFFEFGSEPFVRLRERLWLDTFAEPAASDRSFIFTFNPEATVAPSFIDRARDLVESAGGRVHFIELTCSHRAIEQRLREKSRAGSGKLQSVELFRELESSGAFDFPSLPEPIVQVATDEVDPDEAARVIRDRVELAERDSKS